MKKQSKNDRGRGFGQLFRRVARFQRRAFPRQSAKSKLLHLRREAMEAIRNPRDRSELADCLILVLGAAKKRGLSARSLLRAAHAKQNVNDRRSWGRADKSGIHHHL